MAKSGLKGPYQLSDSSINEHITRKSPGAYVLGEDKGDSFTISYVGRSDDDVNDRLHYWVGHYNDFKFDYFDSPKAAFEKECRIWHDFGGAEGKLDNEIHPQRPKDANWQCPACDTFK